MTDHIQMLKEFCMYKKNEVYNLDADYGPPPSSECFYYRLDDGWVYRVKDFKNGGRLPFKYQKEIQNHPNFMSGKNPVLYCSKRNRYKYLDDETYECLRYYDKLPDQETIDFLKSVH
jgi:hypothetical protein